MNRGRSVTAVTARLAPTRQMRHALILGVIGVILCATGAIVTRNRGPEFGPHWYPVTLIVSAMPSAWIGGVLVAKHAAE